MCGNALQFLEHTPKYSKITNNFHLLNTARAAVTAMASSHSTEVDWPIEPKADPIVGIDRWIPPSEPGVVRYWSYNGTAYWRSRDNELWLMGADGSLKAWVGIYNLSENKIEFTPPPG